MGLHRGCVCGLLLVLGLLLTLVHGQSVVDLVQDDPDMSEFLSWIKRSQVANLTLTYKQLTIFFPTNEAFQKQDLKMDIDPDTLVPYHITSIPRKTDQFGPSTTLLYSELDENPPLWITHVTGSYHDDIFVNNARIQISKSNVAWKNKNNKQQILHKIDEVLIPTSIPTPSRVYNPTAWQFLENYESLIMHPHRIRHFRQKIQENKKEDIFKNDGGHTFFIPVDEGFSKNKRAALIDGKIIDGHVIPNKVLFTRPTENDYPFETLANRDNIKVFILFTKETRKDIVRNYVKSHTLMSDGKHSQGVVLAEIVKANIPVKNGVVHLIQKPLMVVDNNVKELLEEKEGGILSSFVKAIKDADYREFYKIIENGERVTLFAPCNSAWMDDYTLNTVIKNKEEFKNILKMHLVTDDRLYLDTIKKTQQTGVQTLNPRSRLYFNVVTSGPNKTVTVDGGGVTATIIEADLAATNGVIHIIDRVLGVPYTTVFDKLKSDVTLSKTYELGKAGGFNLQLNDTTKKFTYFVPRNKAWEDAKIDHPSAVKVLFMPEFSYHAKNLLERHLVISDEPYTMERIKQLAGFDSSNNSYHYGPKALLPTVRDQLRISVEVHGNGDPMINETNSTYTIHWKGERIPVFRPNVECTNGIIHVIDAPFLQDGDIRVSGATKLHYAPHFLMLLAVKWLLL